MNNTTPTPTPKQLGFYMPAEWAPQTATWMTWPTAPLTFSADLMPIVEKSFALVIRHLQEDQIVKVLVDNESEKARVAGILEREGVLQKNLQLIIARTEDIWIRDYGPTFVVNGKGQKRAIKWTYNGYGKYFEDLALDTEVFANGVLGDSSIELFDPEMILEGGSIEVNGAGVCLTSKQCLLNPTRNPHLSQAQIEEKLKENLGVEKILWLNEGIVGDDTDGHVDDIARFVDANTIVYVKEENPEDPNFSICQEIENDLKAMTDVNGNPFTLIPLPMPKMFFQDGIPLPASYANFYIGNKVVLVPVFNDANDQKALEILQGCFKDRKVIGIPAREWVHGLGTLHCSTQQEP